MRTRDYVATVDLDGAGNLGWVYFSEGDLWLERPGRTSECLERRCTEGYAVILVESKWPQAEPLEDESERPHTVWVGDGVTLTITLGDANTANHPGECDADVAYVADLPYVREQLDTMDPHEVAECLAEYTDWDVSDHAQNLQRVVWIAAGSILDDLDEASRD